MISLSMFVLINLELVSSLSFYWILILLYVLFKMTTALISSSSFIMMLFSGIFLRLVFVLVRDCSV